MDEIKIPAVRTDNGLPMPSYAYEGDAGIDLRATGDCVLGPLERKLVPCGVAVAIPPGYAGLVLPRSGLAAKHGVSLVNAPGLIDSNYRGEIKAILLNTDPDNAFEVRRGDRVAQLVVVKVPRMTLEEVEDLSSTERGAGGFGSSGVSL